MGVWTHLPSGDWRNEGWSLIGTGVTALFQALNNDDDTKYIKSPNSKSGATVTFPVDITNVPDGAVVTSVTVKLRCGVGTGVAPSGTSPSITVAVATQDDTSRFLTRTINVTSSIQTFEVATYQRDARGFFWDIERLNKILCRVFSYNSIFDLIRCYKFYTEVKYRVRPTITVDAPSGTVYTPSPVISWTYTQSDGDPQARAEYKLFDAVQQAKVSFNPDTEPPVFYASVDGDISSVTLPTSINPNNYWVYVRSISSFGAKSVWVGRQFTVSGPSPGTPGVPDPTGSVPSGTGIVTVIHDSEQGSATLTLRDTSNMLAVQAADAETTTDGVSLVGSNATVTRDTTTAFPGGNASWRLTSVAGGDMSALTDWVEVYPGVPITARGQFKTAATARSARARILFYDGDFNAIGGTLTGTNVTDATGTWMEATVTGDVPAGAIYAKAEYGVLATGGASEIHNVDHLGFMYGTATPYSDGGHMSRNLLSSWYSSVEGTAGAGEAWVAGSANSVGTAVPPGTGGSGATCNKMTYLGLSPSIAYRAASTVFTSPTNGVDYTLNKPAGTATGDLMLAFVTSSEYSTINPPVGWTLVNQARVDDGTTDTSLFVLKRTAGGSEPASWTDGTVGTTSGRRTAVVVGYSGAADVALQFVGETQTASGNATPLYLTSPTITNTDPNAWRISAFALSDDATGGTLTANLQVPSVVPSIAYVGKGTTWYTISGGSSFTINKPSGVGNNDLMIAVLAIAGNVAVTPPAGWTARYTAVGATGPYTHCVMSRLAGSSEPASWTGSTSGGTVQDLMLTQSVAYRNVNTTTPFINNNGQMANSASSISTPSVSNTNSGAWRVVAFGDENGSSSGGWTSDENVERADNYAYKTISSGFFGSTYHSINGAIYDSNGPVSTGNYSRAGYHNTSYYSAGAWIGILNPLAAPPAGVADETARVVASVGSSNPWMTTRIFDSNGVVPTGDMSVTGIWTPGSGTDKNSMSGWVGLVRPAAPVTAGYASATMATKVDVSQVPIDSKRVTVCASFIGSTAGTPYLTVNFYRANVLLNSLVAQGNSFGTGIFVKSYATFDVPVGTTRMNVGVSTSDRAVSDIVYWDRVSLAFGDDPVFRPGTSRSEHPVWAQPEIEFADDDGTGYTPWQVLPGVTANPPSFEPLSGLSRYLDHTVIPLTNRKYRARTISFGLIGDRFVSAWGPDSREFSFEAENWWLKDISDPDSNVELPVKWDAQSVTTTNTGTVFQGLGADLPVVLTEGYKGDMFPLTLTPVSHDTWVRLVHMLESGKTLFLQSDIDNAWWVRPVGDLEVTVLPTGQRQSNPLREIKLSFVQVEPEV